MKHNDITIIGAGPVGLMCAYLAKISGMEPILLDKNSGPLEVGRADALNARTLQLLESVGLFNDLYSLGKPCKTSSIWIDGKFISRQSSWWDELEGCFHKHFLMLGQSYIEKLLVRKLRELGVEVRRETSATDIRIDENECFTTLSTGEIIRSKFLIGADGSRSFVRNHFNIPFEITRPQIVWAVLDGVLETDFPKVPEIIVFQSETSDVAWIPREGEIDRFYVRMDRKDFSFEEALAKINLAVRPHSVSFKEITWFSQFSVKESVTEKYSVQDRVFLAGDSCHIHSVNGGQGLNTGLADAFNLIWKLNFSQNSQSPTTLLKSYEEERRPVALSVIETSGELVRSTKYSDNNTHALDYVKVVEKRAGNITGMGIRYGKDGLPGSRLFDIEIFKGSERTRLYSMLDYSKFTLLIFSEQELKLEVPPYIQVVQIRPSEHRTEFWSSSSCYLNKAILVRPDSYIQAVSDSTLEDVNLLLSFPDGSL